MTSLIDRFRLRMARTIFKNQVRNVTEALSVEELEALANMHGGVAEVLARQTKLPQPVAEANLSWEQLYLYKLGMDSYLELVAEVSPPHADVLRRYPAFAKELREAIGSLLIG